MHGKTIFSVLCADDNYAMQIAVVCLSIYDYLDAKYELTIYILDGGISPQNKEKIQYSLRNLSSLKLIWIPVSGRLSRKKYFISDQVTIATYFRLLIHEVLPSSIDKVIYLDSDLIVQHDISKLWNIDLDDYYLHAVQDSGTPFVSSPLGLLNYQALNLSPDTKYFNAGVLLVNLSKWRQDSIANCILAYIENNREYIRWWDQDGLNAILANSWKELDPRWNQIPAIYNYSDWQDSPLDKLNFERVLSSPYIIHFANAQKPWNSFAEHPANSLFYKYVDRTAWSGWRFTNWTRLTRKVKKLYLNTFFANRE